MAQDDFEWICPVVIELVIQNTIEIYVSREKRQDSIKKKIELTLKSLSVYTYNTTYVH